MCSRVTSASTNACAKSSRDSGSCSSRGQNENANDLLISSRSFQMHQKIWRRDQFGRVKTASRVVTQEERQRRLSNSAKSQERLEWECEQRKKLLRDIDKRRQGSAKSANSSVRHGGVAAALSETALNENVRKESRSFVEEATKSKRDCPSSSRSREECIKDILVPTYNPRIYPRIWRQDEMNRVKTASRVVTKEERQRRVEKLEQDRQRLERESEQRKQLLQEIDKRRQPSSQKHASLDDEENDTVKVLDRAFLAKQEQTEEIMKVNRLILATKCHVVRDAQITEKQEITRTLREEELQMEKKLLEDCDKALKEEEMQREELKKINEKYAEELRVQLKRRELNKFLEAQRIEEEANAIAKAQMSMNEDLRRQEQEKKERIAKMRRDLQQANELSDFFKNLAFEEQRVAEMKAQEHMRKLAEREVELEKDRRLLREQKQREADRLLVLQTKFLETKSEKEEMKLRLLREEKDREFRKREKEAAVRKKQIQQQLLTAREAQVDELKRVREMQIAEEEEQHRRVLDKLREQEEKERREAERLKNMKSKYRKEILKQINEKSSMSKEKKLQILNEFNMEKQKEEMRKKNLEMVIAQKVNAMRRANIPENLIRDVERQINLNETIKFIKQI